MDKISSFKKDHDKLMPGFYLSGTANNVSTFDLRFKKPNVGDFIEQGALHSIEHIMATLLRNSEYKDDIVYFGPMGCRTGFYLLTVRLDEDTARRLTEKCLGMVKDMDYVPGAQKAECGNYLEHDLDGAKKECAAYLALLESQDDNRL